MSEQREPTHDEIGASVEPTSRRAVVTTLRLKNILPRANCQAGLPDGRWVMAMHEPPSVNRFKAAWAVLTGRAYAVAWPFNGEFEQALTVNGYDPSLTRRA